MSKQIDERVVSLQFDNKQFESNVQTTMSTLDKLKHSLRLDGASKGLENVSSAAKNVDMSGLGNGVETVRSKFSALEVMGVTALANISNSAVNAGKRLIASFTIDPVKTGFSEYEMKMDSVKTIMASTGESVEKVNDYLEELNEYSDQTIYSFADMTQNIGKFTNAGVKLEDAVMAIKGISNEAAVSGANANEASRAMYNFAQALSSGYVKLIDWKSIENANMATVEFKQQLIDTAVSMGTVTKASDGMYNTISGKSFSATKNFNDVLQEQWMTSEVLVETLKKYADNTTDIGKKAFAAAQDVTKFTQMMDVLKETAQSGWARTWEILIGDIETAKAIFTPLTNFFSKIIDGISDFRNELLEGALSHNPFTLLLDKLDKTGLGTIKKMVDGTSEMTEKLKFYQDIVDKVWNGDYRNEDTGRYGLLADDGYDFRVVQNLVNQTEFVEGHKVSVEHLTTALKKYGKESEIVADTTKEVTVSIDDLSDAELKALGYTEEEIELLRWLSKESKRTGKSFKELIAEMDKADGRTLLIESFKNAGDGLVTTLKLLKDAWVEAFPPMTSLQLYNLIKGLNEFTQGLRLTDAETGKLNDKGEKVKRIMDGIVALLDIVVTLVSGPLKIAFKIVSKLLEAFGLTFLDVGAVIGDGIVKVRDWLDAVLNFDAVFAWLVPHLKTGAKAIGEWFTSLKDTAAVKKLVSYFSNAGKAIKDWFNNLKNSENLGKDIIDGLVNGLKTGIKTVSTFVIELGKKILETIKGILGIHSPSTEFFDIGKNIILGLVNGIKDGLSTVWTLMMTIGNKLIEIIKNLDIGSIFTLVTGAGLTYGFVTIAKAVGSFADIMDNFGDITEQVEKVIKSFRGVLNGLKTKLYAEAFKSLAISIAILAGSVLLLSLMDQGKVWSAVGAIAALIALMAGLTFVVGKFGGGASFEFGKISLALVGLSAAVLIMAFALKTLADVNPDRMGQTVGLFAAAIGSIILVMSIISKSGKGIHSAAGVLSKLAMAFLLMAIVAKIAGSMDRDELIQGTLAIAAFGLIIVGLMAATNLIAGSKNVGKIGSAIFGVAGAILMMIFVAKIAGGMDRDELIQGTLAIVAFGGIIVGLMAATKLISGSNNVGKIGSAIFGIAAAILIMMLVAKMASKMEPGDLAKGVVAIAAFGGIIVGLMAATKLITGSKNIDKIGRSLLMISVSIGIMAMVAALLSLMDIGALAKGIGAVAVLGAIVAGLIFVTKFAKNVTSTLITITVAIGLLALSVGLLSMIDQAKLWSATGAIAVLLGMLALVVSATGNIKKAWSTVLSLAAVIAVIAGALYLVGQLPVENALGSALALSVLMVALSGVMVIISKINVNIKNVAMGALGLLALCVPLLALVGILALMQNVQNATTNAIILAGLATVLTLLLIPLTVVGLLYTATGGMAMLGLVGLLAMCVPLLALVGILAIMQNIQNATENTKILITLMTAMTAMLVVLAIVGPLALIGVTAMAALTALIVAIGALVVGIGYLMQEFPALQSFIDSGIPVLIQLAGGIGEMIGAFVGGIAKQIAATLPGIGLALSEFMVNATPFIIGAKTVDEAVLKGVGILAASVLALTAVDFLEGIVSFLNGGASFSTLGTELSNFMINALPFINNASLIKPEIMTGVKTLAEAILILAGANMVDVVTSFLGGGSSLATFGSQLGQLGTDLKTFITNIGTFTDDQVTTVDCAGRAIKALAESAKTIPNEGGLWASIVGENSLGAFGSAFPQLGSDLKAFVTNLGTFTEDQVTTVDCAGRAIKALAEAAKELPNEGGFWASVVGDNSLATFSSRLPQLGSDLGQFIINLGTFGEDSISTVDCAGRAIKALAEAAKTIPNEGGFWASIVGDNSLATFGSKLPQLGTDIAGFVSNLGTFGEGQINTVNSACSAIKALAGLGEIDLSDTSSGMIKLGKKLGEFAGHIKSFVEKMGKISGDSISSAIKRTKDLISLAQTAANTNVESLKTFGSSLKSIATDGVKGFVKEFSGDAPKAKVKEAANEMLKAFIKAAEGKGKDVNKAFKKIAEAAADELTSRSIKNDFESAGKDLVKGFANGIKNNKSLATDAGSALGKAALKAAKKALDEHSPSKEMYKVGNYAGIGFVNALYDNVSRAYAAGSDMADSAKSGLSKAIAKVTDVINSDIDAQPTIRPVLDLSDVRAGANSINGMFSGRTLAVNANSVGAISASMLGYQNGNNSSEIVSGIRALRKDIANMPRNQYNLNGINIEEGSDVADAIQVLVRAARIEGRI